MNTGVPSIVVSMHFTSFPSSRVRLFLDDFLSMLRIARSAVGSVILMWSFFLYDDMFFSFHRRTACVMKNARGPVFFPSTNNKAPVPFR